MYQRQPLVKPEHLKLSTIIEDTLVPHNDFQTARFRVEQIYNHFELSREPTGLALIGESRTGKSRVLHECLLAHPSTRRDDGMHIPILYLRTPSKPTVKGLAELMLEKTHDPLPHVGTEGNKTSRLIKLLPKIGTRVVMLDEFHHFRDKSSFKIQHQVADWLKILADDAPVALVVSGLESCREVINQNEQLSGRFKSPVEMHRFSWTNAVQRKAFKGILAAFEKSLGRYFELPELASPDMAFRIYCATGGLIGYLTKLLRQAVWNAIDDKSKVITFDGLAKAFSETTWDVENISKVIQPFNSKLTLQPTKNIIKVVQTIGTRSNELEAVNKPRRKKSQRVNANEALVS